MSIKDLLFGSTKTDTENYKKINDKINISNPIKNIETNNMNINNSKKANSIKEDNINLKNVIIANSPSVDTKLTLTNCVFTNKKTFDMINSKYIKINKGIYILNVNEEVKDNEIGLNSKQRNFSQ